MIELLRSTPTAAARAALATLAIVGVAWSPAACGGESKQAAPVRDAGRNAPTAGEETTATAALGDADRDAPAEVVTAPADDAAAIARLGARPAWDLVIDRAQYLARRHQEGVAWGRLDGDAGSGAPATRWLIDESSGDGTLAIPVALPPGVTVSVGDRIAARGAWDLDGDRRWFWRSHGVERLPGGLAVAPSHPPGHTIALAVVPDDAVAVGAARVGRTVLFYPVDLPRRPGDGWKIADKKSGEPLALLHLPGERDSYGGLDMRTAAERWLLGRGERYMVVIGKVRAARTPGSLPVLQASGPPRRTPP